MADPIVPVKAGVVTSEFYITIIATIIITGITLANHYFHLGLDVYETASTVVPAVLYILGRTGIKIFASISAKAIVDKISSIVNDSAPKPPVQ